MRFSEPMDGRIKVRVSRAEKAVLANLARERGMTLSQLLRDGAKALGERLEMQSRTKRANRVAPDRFLPPRQCALRGR